jgi:hypothetical protein
MPLINFKTDLTSLQFGGDRPGGGSSGQPYIQFPIDNIDAPPDIRRYYEANRTGLDFPVRGGAITQLITGGLSVISSTIDRERIQKFFKDAPRGTAFIEKQVGLQLTNPRIQVPNSLTFAGPSLKNAVLPVTNVYNPLNTLAQVQVQGTGAHFNRHGVVPTIYESPQQTYAYIVGAPQNNTEVTNRLSILRALKLVGSTNFLVNPDVIGGVGIDPTLVDRLGISTIQNQLFNYQGGPGSVYGIGFTRIFRYTDTNVTKLSETNPDPNFSVGGITTQPYSTIAFSYQQIAEQKTNQNGGIPSIPQIQDFREQLPGNIPKTDYSVYNIAKPFNGAGGLGIGNPGGPLTDPNPLVAKADGTDLLNALNPFYYNASATDPWTAGGRDSKDIIKFAFECMSNDNPEYAVALVFRAFLEGGISDSNTGEYNAFKYLGRGETFRTYQGFDRTIGFSFKVFAQSRNEIRPLYTKLNALISQVYPDYSPQSNLMRGSVVRLTIGDYIYRMPGFIENVNVTIDNSNTPWEIQLYGPLVESDVAQLPHMVTVQCTFKPIMDTLPARVTMTNPNVPLIGNVAKNTFLGYIKDSTPAKPVLLPRIDIPTVNVADAQIAALQTRANTNPITAIRPETTKDAKQIAAVQNAKAKATKATQKTQVLFDQIGIPKAAKDNTAVRPPIIITPPR